MVRRKHPKKLNELQRARFLEEARALWSCLNELSSGVEYGSDDHKALNRLHAALLQSVVEVTGEPASWTQIAAGSSWPECRS